jgi:hypothetical protein
LSKQGSAEEYGIYLNKKKKKNTVLEISSDGVTE